MSTALKTRRFARTVIDAPAEIIISPEHRSQVRFTSIAMAPQRHVLRCTATDLSGGGIGVESRHFLPRGLTGILRIIAPGTVLDSRALPPSAILLEHAIRVRRTILRTREPLFAVGVEFIDATPTLDATLERVAAALGTSLVPGAEPDA